MGKGRLPLSCVNLHKKRTNKKHFGCRKRGHPRFQFLDSIQGAHLDSVFLNSSGSMVPPPSRSSIRKSCCKSFWSISMTRKRFWNSRTLIAPSRSSSKVKVPSLLASILRNIRSKSRRSSSASSSISMAMVVTSRIRCSAKVSTTTSSCKSVKIC